MATHPEQRAEQLLRRHYPGIDALRGFATLLVFLCHYVGTLWSAPVFAWGWVGVDVFFVLSGFLITGILFDSLQEESYFRRFYVRRAFRIFPLYFGFWLLMLLLTPLLHTEWNGHLLLNALYLSNLTPSSLGWTLRFGGRWAPLPMLSVGHFWSLCVEEHFYLGWPFVVFFLRDRVRLMRFCAGAAVLAPSLRTAMFFLHPRLTHETGFLYNCTLFRCDALFIGAWVALWLRGSALEMGTVRRRCLWISLLAGGAIFAAQAQCLVFYKDYGTQPTVMLPWTETFGFSLIDVLAACLLISCLMPDSWPYRMLRGAKLQKLGLVSYGFYVLHHLPLNSAMLMGARLARHHLQAAVTVALFFVFYGAAQLSYRYLESPFLRLKERYGATPADPFPYPPPAPTHKVAGYAASAIRDLSP